MIAWLAFLGSYASDNNTGYLLHAIFSNESTVFSNNTPGAKTIKKNTNSTQNKFQTHRAKQYEVTSFLSTDCELSTETCSKNVYSLGPWVHMQSEHGMPRNGKIMSSSTYVDMYPLHHLHCRWFTTATQCEARDVRE